MARVRLYHAATRKYRNDDVTDGYGMIEFGPVHEGEEGDYRISQGIPEGVATSLINHGEAFTEHEAESELEDDPENIENDGN